MLQSSIYSHTTRDKFEMFDIFYLEMIMKSAAAGCTTYCAHGVQHCKLWKFVHNFGKLWTYIISREVQVAVRDAVERKKKSLTTFPHSSVGFFLLYAGIERWGIWACSFLQYKKQGSHINSLVVNVVQSSENSTVLPRITALPRITPPSNNSPLFDHFEKITPHPPINSPPPSIES